MKYDYKYGNHFYNYYGDYGIKSTKYKIIAPGYFWPPLQPACWIKEKIPSLGADAAMARCAMPYELASTFVYLASDDASYMTGQVIHNNGRQVMG